MQPRNRASFRSKRRKMRLSFQLPHCAIHLSLNVLGEALIGQRIRYFPEESLRWNGMDGSESLSDSASHIKGTIAPKSYPAPQPRCLVKHFSYPSNPSGFNKDPGRYSAEEDDLLQVLLPTFEVLETNISKVLAILYTRTVAGKYLI